MLHEKTSFWTSNENEYIAMTVTLIIEVKTNLVYWLPYPLLEQSVEIFTSSSGGIFSPEISIVSLNIYKY